MTSSLVGSEMCIRDRDNAGPPPCSLELAMGCLGQACPSSRDKDDRVLLLLVRNVLASICDPSE
eukprot:7414184-Prorocentrum_lima.AAC.1